MKSLNFILLILLTLAAISFTEGAQAMDQKCELALSTSAAVDPIDLALNPHTDLRRTLRSRMKSPTDLHFDTPEFKPVIQQALAELDSLEKRVHLVKSINPITLTQKNILIPQKILALRNSMQQMLAEGVTYWPTLEASHEFTVIVDAILNLEGGRHWLDKINKRKVDYEQIAKNMITYPVVYVPSFKALTIQDINRFFSAGVLPLGLVTEPTTVDGRFYSAQNFLEHDTQHANTFIASLRLLVGQQDNAKPISSLQREEVEEALRINRLKLNFFFSKVNQLTDEKIKNAVEFAFFILDHELNHLIDFYKSPLTIHEHCFNSGTSSIDHHYSHVKETEFPRNLPKCDDTLFWNKIRLWIIDNWNNFDEIKIGVSK